MQILNPFSNTDILLFCKYGEKSVSLRNINDLATRAVKK